MIVARAIQAVTGSIVFAIVHAAEAGWASAATISALDIGLVLLIGLVVNESRASQPIAIMRRHGQTVPLPVGILVTLAGMLWLSPADLRRHHRN